MTPTMSEYFAAWKNSRFIAGDEASENAFVGGVAAPGHRRHPRRARACLRQRRSRWWPRPTPRRPSRPSRASTSLREFAAGPAAKEDAGRKFTAEEADTLGSRGPGARGGDRRPGHPGGRAARTSRSRRAERRSAPVSSSSPPSCWRWRRGVAPAQAAPPWQCAQRARTSSSRRRLRCCSTSRALPRRCRPGRGSRCAGRWRGGLRARRARGIPRGAGGACGGAARREAMGTRWSSPPPRGACGRRSCTAPTGRRSPPSRRGDAERARAAGCCCASSARRPASRAPAWTRPSRYASSAAGRLAPRKAALEVRKDLLDAYQASLTARLGEAEAAGERGFGARCAQTAARAAGLWPTRSPPRPSAAAAPPPEADAAFAELASARTPGGFRSRAARASARRPSRASSPRPSPAPSRPVAPPSCALPRPDPDRVRPRHRRRPCHLRLRDPGGGGVPRREPAAFADLGRAQAARPARAARRGRGDGAARPTSRGRQGRARVPGGLAPRGPAARPARSRSSSRGVGARRRPSPTST